MAALTTVSRVRDRMGFTTSDLTDPILTDFISDQQAFVERATRRTYEEGDDDFEFARSVVTDLAAMMALVRLTGGTTSGLDYKIGKLDVTKKGQLANRLRVIFEIKVRARGGLAILERLGETKGSPSRASAGGRRRGTTSPRGELVATIPQKFVAFPRRHRTHPENLSNLRETAGALRAEAKPYRFDPVRPARQPSRKPSRLALCAPRLRRVVSGGLLELRHLLA